jgi:hypothetical protein
MKLFFTVTVTLLSLCSPAMAQSRIGTPAPNPRPVITPAPSPTPPTGRWTPNPDRGSASTTLTGGRKGSRALCGGTPSPCAKPAPDENGRHAGSR